MLSLVYGMVRRFERKNGCKPNLLYLNNKHFDSLRKELEEIKGLGQLTCFLGMEVVLSDEYLHPQVIWTPESYQVALTG